MDSDMDQVMNYETDKMHQAEDQSYGTVEDVNYDEGLEAPPPNGGSHEDYPQMDEVETQEPETEQHQEHLPEEPEQVGDQEEGVSMETEDQPEEESVQAEEKDVEGKAVEETENLEEEKKETEGETEKSDEKDEEKIEGEEETKTEENGEEGEEIKKEDEQSGEVLTVEDDGKPVEPPPEPIKLIPDDEYFPSLEPEELDWYKENMPDLDRNVHCTACFKQVTPDIGAFTGIFRHPTLGVVVCKQCLGFYMEGIWTKDEDGCDMFCRWCAEGGELILCDKCPSSFCKRCLQRNMGRQYVKEITSSDEWSCINCDPKQIYEHKALYYGLYTHEAELREKRSNLPENATLEKSKAVLRMEKEIEELPENFLDENIMKAFNALREYEKTMEDEKQRWIIANRELDLEVATGITRRMRKIYAITKQKMDKLDKDIVTSYVKTYPLESTRIHMGHIEPVLDSDDEDIAAISAPKRRRSAAPPKKRKPAPKKRSAAAKKKPLKVPPKKNKKVIVVNGRAVTGDPSDLYVTPSSSAARKKIKKFDESDSDIEIIGSSAPPPLKKRKTGKF